MSLNEVWEAASASPYTPYIGKESQFSIGFGLLLSGKSDLSTEYVWLGCIADHLP